MDVLGPLLMVLAANHQNRQAQRIQLRQRRRPRRFPPRLFLEAFTEEEVLRLFRLSKAAIRQLYELIVDKIKNPTQRTQSIPGMCKLLAVLHFLGSGSFQYCVSTKMGFSQPTFSRILRQVVNALNSITTQFIKFPFGTLEQRRVKEDFYRKYGFPNTLGLIDCTHVALIPPADREQSYRNRKLFHSINVQLICGPKNEILDVVARFRGGTHDAFILNQSKIGQLFRAGYFGNSILLGDNGYRLTPWLLTPFLHPTTVAQHHYNDAHRRTRSQVERVFGILKSRFRCLDVTGGALLYSPELVCEIILACCVLHNIANEHNIPFTLATDLREHINFQGGLAIESSGAGQERRDELVTRFFNNS